MLAHQRTVVRILLSPKEAWEMAMAFDKRAAEIRLGESTLVSKFFTDRTDVEFHLEQ